MAKSFAFGDLVWARMKHFPLWPAKVVEPTAEVKTKDKKHYVFFFGTEDHAWIADKNIFPHSKELLEASKSYTKPKPSLKAAIDRIEKEGSKILKTKTPKTKTLNTESSSDWVSKKSVKPPSKKSMKQLPGKSPKSPQKSLKVPQKSFKAPQKSLKSPQKPLKAPQKPPKSPQKLPKSSEKSPKQATEKSPKLTSGRSPKLTSRKSAKFTAKKSPKPGFGKIPKPSTSQESGHSKTPLISSGVCKVPRKGKKRPISDISVPIKIKKESPPLKTFKMDEDSLESLALEASNIAVVLPLDPYASKFSSIRVTEKRIGFIGLGMMGQRVVTQLINSGHVVTIYNRTLEKCRRFVDAGAIISSSPADLITECDITFCCVTGPEAAYEITFGPDGILEGLLACPFDTRGIVELSSIGPFMSEKIAEAIVGSGGRYLNAVISGSLRLAEEGSLLIIGSGSRQLFNECESCFFSFAKNAYFLAPDVSYGSKVNLILNMFMSTANVALAEALSLIDGCELSMLNFLEIFELSPLGCRMMIEKGNNMRHQTFFPPDNTLKHQMKDLELALEMGTTYAQPLQLPSLAHEVYQKAKKDHSDSDVSAVFNGVRI